MSATKPARSRTRLTKTKLPRSLRPSANKLVMPTEARRAARAAREERVERVARAEREGRARARKVKEKEVSEAGVGAEKPR